MKYRREIAWAGSIGMTGCAGTILLITLVGGPDAGPAQGTQSINPKPQPGITETAPAPAPAPVLSMVVPVAGGGESVPVPRRTEPEQARGSAERPPGPGGRGSHKDGSVETSRPADVRAAHIGDRLRSLNHHPQWRRRFGAVEEVGKPRFPITTVRMTQLSRLLGDLPAAVRKPDIRVGRRG